MAAKQTCHHTADKERSDRKGEEFKSRPVVLGEAKSELHGIAGHDRGIDVADIEIADDFDEAANRRQHHHSPCRLGKRRPGVRVLSVLSRVDRRHVIYPVSMPACLTLGRKIYEARSGFRKRRRVALQAWVCGGLSGKKVRWLVIRNNNMSVILSKHENYGLIIESEDFARLQSVLFETLRAMSTPVNSGPSAAR